MVMPFTSSLREKMSGIICTPTVRDCALKNASLLNRGSSAIEMLDAVTPPEKTESFRFSSLTCRPRVLVSLDSSKGRN